MRIDANFIIDIRKPEQGQAIYRDDELTGFALRVGTGSASYIVECRVNGMLRRVTLGRLNQFTPEEAREKAQAVLSGMTSQRIHASTRIPTLAEVLEDYIGKKRLRERTISHYREVIRYYLPDWEHVSVTDITEQMVLARHRQLGEQKSGMCANQAMIVLRMLLYHAARTHKTPDGMSLIPVNPVTALSDHRQWYRKKRRQGVIPDHQLAPWYRAVMACTNPTVRDFLLLVITTGLRKREAGTLKWTDVDLEARTITISGELTKNHREHKLPLSGFLMTLLSRRRAECGDSSWVFPGGSDGHLDLNLCRVTDRIAEQCNCPFTPHDLRRSLVSMAANLKVPHHLAKRLLNHIGQKDDTDEYIVISTENLREPMEQISQRFLELMGADPAYWGSYNVHSNPGDVGNTSLVATHLAAAISGNSTLIAAGISAIANGPLVTVSGGTPFLTQSNLAAGTNPAAMALTPNGGLAYVCNSGAGTVTPINTYTNSPGSAITVGTSPSAIAITPSGLNAYICNSGSGTVTPISTATNTAGTAITVGTTPSAIAITPNGYTGYVCNNGSGTVTPITLSTNTAGTAISVGTNPAAIALTPNGASAYVCNSGSGTVTPITTSTNTAGTAIAVGTNPTAVAITPNGTTAYVCNSGSGTVTPIATLSNGAYTAVTVGTNPTAVAITLNGATAYICNKGSNTVTPITTATNTAGTAISVGSSPSSIAMTCDGLYALVTNNGGGTVSVISTATNTVVQTITVGTNPGNGVQGIACMPNSDAAYVANYGSANVTPIVPATVTVSPSGSGSTSATLGGGGRVAQVTNSVIANSPITYSYDALGRSINRMINGGNNNVAWGYDAISRITSETNALSATAFAYAYVNDVSGSSKGDPRLASITYPNSQVTNFSYLPTIQDECLQEISNLKSSGGATLSQFNYAFDAPGEIQQWQQQQNVSGTLTNSHFDLGYDNASQLTAAVADSGSSFNVYISGTAHTGDVVSVTAYDASLTGSSGQETASYTVQSGDTLGNIATHLATNIGTAMSNISATASANTSTSTVTISTSPSFTTSFTAAVTGSGATETIAVSKSTPIANLHKQLYYAYDCAGNRTGVQGDSSGTFAGNNFATTATQYSFNNVNELVGSGAGGPIAFQATTTNPVTQVAVNVTQTATIAGTIHAGDVVWIMVHDKGLSKAEPVSYTVTGSDSWTTIATALKNAINADTTLSTLGVTATSSGAVVTISSSSVNATTYTGSVNPTGNETIGIGGSLGVAANITPSTAFTASPTLAGSTSSTANTATINALSGGGTSMSPPQTYGISINAATPATLTYDNDGNMTSDGTNSYAWDAENRLLQITYPGSGNNSQFSYDGLGKCVKIVEVTGGSTTSTKQFIWCGNERCEVRDSGGTTILAQFFKYGETISGTPYYFTKDHLGSVREMTNASGTIVWQQSFDPYGVPTAIVSTTPADIGYAGYYLHSRSGLNLTWTRAYNSSLGRFINRDRFGERGGVNLYAYVGNEPIGHVDPSGLWQWYGNWGGPNWGNGTTQSEDQEDWPREGEPGFVPPTDCRDRCYYNHDRDLNDCGRLPGGPDRQVCRAAADRSVAACLRNTNGAFDRFPGETAMEAGFFGFVQPNDNEGTPSGLPNPRPPR